MHKIPFWKCGITSKPGHDAFLIDGRGRVPEACPEIADISHSAVPPNHRVNGGISSHGLIANARDTDGLPAIINRCSRPGSVTGDERQFANLVFARSIDDRAKL